MLKRLLSPILKPFAALVADEINQVHSDEISKRLDSMTAELRQIASHLALSAIYDGRPELTFKELLGDVDFPELWKDHLFRLKHQKLIDTVTDEVVNIVWHAKELSVDKGLAILVRNYESAIGKRAYCLSRIILYWVGQQFYCPNSAEFRSCRCLTEWRATPNKLPMKCGKSYAVSFLQKAP